MSLFLPAVRIAVRRAPLLARPIPSATTRLLRRQRLHPLLAARTYATRPPQSDPPSKDPPGPPKKDALSGDVPIVPGGILAELAGAPKDVEPLPEGTRAEDYISSVDKKREQISRYFYWAALLGILGGSVYLGRPIDELEKENLGWHNLPEGHSPTAYWTRLNARTKAMIGYFQEPAFPKVLHDKPPEPYSMPYTLILDLEGLLVHAEWTREHGWRTAKRPGVDYFLLYLSQFYEIVVFSSNYSPFVAPIVERLDPYHSFWSGALFREHTRYIDGKVVKDLSHINRDLSKVIILDTNPDSVSLQPENAIVLPTWKGDIDDKGLIAILPFLEYLASQNFNDLRPILVDYKTAAERQHLTIAETFFQREQRARKALEKSHKPSEIKPQESGSFFAKLLGLKPAQPPPLPVPIPEENPDEILTPLDYTRMMAQGGYTQIKKAIEENKDKIVEEDKKRMAEAMAEQRGSLWVHAQRLLGLGPSAEAAGEKKEEGEGNKGV